MKTIFCIAAVCMISTIGFGGDEDQVNSIFPVCPPNCAKKPPTKIQVKTVAFDKLTR